MWLLDWFSSALDGKYLFKVFIVKMCKVHPNQSVLSFLACTSLCTKQASMAPDRVELTTVQFVENCRFCAAIFWLCLMFDTSVTYL